MNKDLIIYNTEDGQAKISLTLQDGTVWLNQLQIAELFQTTKQILVNILEQFWRWRIR